MNRYDKRLQVIEEKAGALRLSEQYPLELIERHIASVRLGLKRFGLPATGEDIRFLIESNFSRHRDQTANYSPARAAYLQTAIDQLALIAIEDAPDGE